MTVRSSSSRNSRTVLQTSLVVLFFVACTVWSYSPAVPRHVASPAYRAVNVGSLRNNGGLVQHRRALPYGAPSSTHKTTSSRLSAYTSARRGGIEMMAATKVAPKVIIAGAPAAGKVHNRGGSLAFFTLVLMVVFPPSSNGCMHLIIKCLILNFLFCLHVPTHCCLTDREHNVK